jgi:hypothetical protein
LFTVEIDTRTLGLDAEACDREVATLLREIADRLEGGNRGMAITNKGTVLGSWGYAPEKPD